MAMSSSGKKIKNSSEQDNLLKEGMSNAFESNIKEMDIPREMLSEQHVTEEKSDESPRVTLPTILTVLGFKDGAAKTTTSVCLAVALGKMKKKVLVIDLDEQGPASQYLGVYDPLAEKPCIADAILPNIDGGPLKTLDDVMIETDYKCVSIVPSSFRFTDADSRMRIGAIRQGVAASRSTATASQSDMLTFTSTAFTSQTILAAQNVLGSRLRDAIKELDEHFDYIIIDCPSSLGLTITNAITALEAGAPNSALIVPVRVDRFAIAGLSQTIGIINRVAAERCVVPAEWRILRTMVEKKTSAYKVGMGLIENSSNEVRFFDAAIPKATIVPESMLEMVPLVKYAPDSKPAKAYRKLAREIMKRASDRSSHD